MTRLLWVLLLAAAGVAAVLLPAKRTMQAGSAMQAGRSGRAPGDADPVPHAAAGGMPLEIPGTSSGEGEGSPGGIIVPNAEEEMPSAGPGIVIADESGRVVREM